MKRCFKCGVEKPVEFFYRHPQMADGHLGKCKDCTKHDVAQNYQARRQQYAEYERNRFQRPERKEKAVGYHRNAALRNPEKAFARHAISNAIRDGRLHRKPCEVCGNAKSEGHHPDYSKPLSVMWLCRKHHLEQHGKQAYEFAQQAQHK
ncbi:MAG: hypothetical protein ACR2IJ_10675 [Fluviibacter sp.]